MTAFQERMLQRQQERQKPKKAEKTKEELAQIRKDMMKKRPVTAKTVVEEKKEHPKSALMSRLAQGAKVEISKKDMKALTQKNYENLPEVRKKREEEKMKQERLARIAQSR